MHRFSLLYVAPTLALLALALGPLIAGRETLYTRDVLTSHYPMKVSQAEAMGRGELPLVDPYRAGGQPLLGNPNALPLYPDNLLYLAASPLWALNAHFWLHLLIAPFAGFWLGRAWGLRRPAAWAVGVCYAASGFFLSLLNLYNLVAGAALAPAFIAACLDVQSGRERPGRAAAGLLWALLLLAGDPFFAGLTLLLALSAVVVRAAGRRNPPSIPPRQRSGWLRLGMALACGTLLAAPMLVEFLRILPLSFRGYWQYSPGAALSQSWDPRSVAEWLLPFFFGRPDFTFWGQRFYGGNPPLFYSLYPGLPALALVLLAGRPRGWRSPGAWAWGWVAGGLFFAAGAWNPAVRLLYHLPGAAVLRFPVKLSLAVAVGAALLCGLGFERLMGERSPGGRRRLGWILAALAAFYAAVFALFLRLPGPVGGWLRNLDPERLAAALFERQRLDWAWVTFLSLAVLALSGLILRLAWRRPHAGGALLLLVHLAAQLVLLQPLYDSDAAEYYTRPPAALAAVPRDSLVVHGGSGDLFGELVGSPLELFPDPRFSWLARAHFAQLYPFSGIPWGRRYELNHSPEGLDSFFVVSLARAVRKMPDVARLRILEASGVDVLLLDRELDAEARPLARLRRHFPAAPRRAPESGEYPAAAEAFDLYVYELPRAAPPVQMVGTVRLAPHMNAALELLSSPSFDPRSMVVLPAAGPTDGGGVERPGGRVEILSRATEKLEARVSSEAGGVLVTQRAFLAIWRASIDGQPAEPVVANVHRLAVEVPAGEHRVRLWVDRRPTTVAWIAAAMGLAGLAVIARRDTAGRAEIAEGEGP